MTKQEICEALASGKTIREVSELSGVPMGTVYGWAVRFGPLRCGLVSLKRKRRHPRRLDIIEGIKQGKSVGQVSREMSVPVKFIEEITGEEFPGGLIKHRQQLRRDRNRQIIYAMNVGESAESVAARFGLKPDTILRIVKCHG